MKPGAIADKLRRELNKKLKQVDTAFEKHLGGRTKRGDLRQSASSFCADCQHYWGELKSLKFAIELTKKNPQLGDLSDVEPG